MAEIKIAECAACGKVFEFTGTRRKYCDKCKKLTQTRQQAIMQKRLEEEAAAAERLLEYQRQADPYDPRLMSDKRLGAVIKMFRMTYGTYTAAYRSGILPQLLRSRGFADPEKMIRQLEVE